MDVKTASALHRFRLVSAIEAVSFLLLLVCSVLKRTTDFNGVPVMGAIHGALVVVFVVFWAFAWHRARWTVVRGGTYFVLSLIPFGGFFAERMLRTEIEQGMIAARTRAEAVTTA